MSIHTVQGVGLVGSLLTWMAAFGYVYACKKYWYHIGKRDAYLEMAETARKLTEQPEPVIGEDLRWE